MGINNQKKVIIMCFSGGNGGMELDAIKLAHLLGGQMSVALFCKKGSFIHQSNKGVQNNYHLEPVDFASRAFSLSMLLKVRALMKIYTPDNVIFFGASELKTLYFAFLGYKVNLLVRHGTTKKRPKTDLLHSLIYSRVNYHIALSKHLLRNVKNIVPRTNELAYRIIFPSYNISTSKHHSDITRSEYVQITHVGRIALGKGQIDAVCACKQLENRGIIFQLDFLGALENDNYENKLKDKISAANLSSRVHLRGHVTNVQDYLAKTDIFLFPSTGEGMPNAFIEAMHYNNVCVAYDNTVFSEFRDMGFYIHLVSNGDIDALAQKLTKVALNIECEKSKSKKNVTLVNDYFKVERELAQWDDVLV